MELSKVLLMLALLTASLASVGKAQFQEEDPGESEGAASKLFRSPVRQASNSAKLPVEVVTTTKARPTPAATSSAQTATGNCAQFAPFKLYSLPDVYACFNSFPISNDLKAAETDALKRFYAVYPFGDINPPNTPIFVNKVDFLQRLDAITASATNLFDYYSQLTLLVRSMNDAHFSLDAQCITTFTFMQPFHIAAFYPTDAAGKPVLRIVGNLGDQLKNFGGVPARWTSALPSGATLDSFNNYAIKSIDGQDAVAYAQDYAAKYSGFSRSPDTNFNQILYRKDYVLGEYQANPGILYRTSFLGRDAKPTRSYTLVPPTGGREITLTFPWLGSFDALANPDVPRPASNDEYYRLFCVPTRRAQNLVRRDGTGGASGFPGKPKLPTWSTGYGGPIEYPSSAEPVLAVGPLAASSRLKGAALDLNKPIVADNSTAFYVLEDGVTGVWVFATTQPADSSPEASKAWIETMFNGIMGLNKAGVKKLIIDVSGNGGGQFCTATGIAEYLLANTTMITDQIKLTATTRALMKVDYLGLQAVGGVADAKALDSGDVTVTTTKKDRGRGVVELSGFFRLCQAEKAEQRFADAPRLPNPWNASDIVVLSDGFCGSACSCMIRTLRDAHGIRTFTYGGASGQAFTPTSFEGGIVVPFETIATFADVSALSWLEREALPRNFTSLISGQIPVTQGYSFNGKYGQEWPAEFVPAPADVHLTGIEDVTDRTAVWRAVAAQLASSTVGGAPSSATEAPLVKAKNGAAGSGTEVRAALAVVFAGLLLVWAA
ncbi:hypothetical protein HDU96_005228 [Phlyctochytrium bullatum]|nr:hypothetical protein HDU96_005228 [Phlyctochytrium bullatum]